MRFVISSLALFALAAAAALPHRVCTAGPAFTDPAQADDAFPYQGEYAGEIEHEGEMRKFGVQVIALGDGTFDAVAYPGGLPGAGWNPPQKIRGKGKREGTVVKIEGVDWGGTTRRGEIRDGALIVLDDAGKSAATFQKQERTSPTLGQKPPPGAKVIFDGTSVDGVTGGRMSEDGLLMEGVTSKEAFGDGLWHIEFRLPYQPKDRGQGRGNSGAYIQGCYEVQMLDSFGLEGKDNECGGIYSAAAPSVNMCLPPLAWQTYDSEFTAATYEDGQKVKPARMTVRHNGVVVHNDVEVKKGTPGGTQGEGKPFGPLHLQNHGNPVRYRNIWVLPKQ